MTSLMWRAAALLLLMVATYCQAKGNIEDLEPTESPMTTVDRAKGYYTEMMVQGVGKEPKACSEKVLASRRNAKITVGVEPTVGLGSALLIFLGVGVFAVVIAQTFQMVIYAFIISLGLSHCQVWFIPKRAPTTQQTVIVLSLEIHK